MIGICLSLCMILSIVTIMDLRYFRIPNVCCALLGGIGIAYSLLMNQSLIDCIIGCMSMSLPLIILYTFTHRMIIGGGDIKLLAASGMLLGWKKNILAFLISGCCILIHKIWRPALFYKGKRIALGPYLSIGILVSFIAGDFLVECYGRWPGISI